ncbi:putative metal-binding motif-containing protein [Candidatus Uhrbacteria bacterium]|nr:putative metal-binding motif-containing protein [Candidatus Uhrbacteria bacterium]
MAAVLATACQSNPFGSLEASYDASADTSSQAEASPATIDKDNDGVPASQDCDDNDPKVGKAQTWYFDNDGDGWGNTSATFVSCTKPASYVDVSHAGDCADADKSSYPGAPELCDGKDNDCDGKIDNATGNVWYFDADGDQRGDPGAIVTGGCKAPNAKLVGNADDCDDLNPKVYKNAPELCDGVDNNCNGQIDEGVKIPIWVDADGDGFGDKSKPTFACKVEPGFAGNADDCDDKNIKVNPKAAEVCNNVDDNCNGQTDEGTTTTFYADEDGDSFGNAAKPVQACSLGPGLVTAPFATDCSDTNAKVNPKADELCDGIDNNCDGKTDEPSAKDAQVYYLDEDGDGFGLESTAVKSCAKPSSKHVLITADCNDDPKVGKAAHPGATEICDGLDNDCDGKTDEGTAQELCDDGLPYTTDACSGKAGCVNLPLPVTLTCKVPSDAEFKFNPAEDSCSAAVFYSKVAGGEVSYSALSIKEGTLTPSPADLCAMFKDGWNLHVEDLVSTMSGVSGWVGGEYVTVKVDGKPVKGTPGSVTILPPGLDFIYTAKDFGFCP